MQLNTLTAISPIDGRYRKKINELSPFFSEFGLIKYRLMVEVEYFIALCEIPLPQLDIIEEAMFPVLRALYENFDIKEAEKIKEIEKTTNHDVKAVEYYLKDAFDQLGLSSFKEFIHFGLTSQDINNTAVPLSIADAFENVFIQELEDLIELIGQMGKDWCSIPMLSRTHGQTASPTLLGKEILVFWDRLIEQYQYYESIPHAAKFGGAVGNFNAHYVAYPDINWMEFGEDFLEHLGLYRTQFTTQIEPYDHMAAMFDFLKRINTILIDFSRDIWTYISMDYFKQRLKEGEVGSSTMPHKVNPIDFENAEGNLGIANALFEHMSAKLPISRLQRDLTDSTVSRNIGVPIAHSLLAMKNLTKGLHKLVLNEAKIEADLEDNWVVVAEAIQTVLRRESYPNPYEALKALTRQHNKITQTEIHAFVDGLDISNELKEELKAISPFNYTGRVPDFEEDEL